MQALSRSDARSRGACICIYVVFVVVGAYTHCRFPRDFHHVVPLSAFLLILHSFGNHFAQSDHYLLNPPSTIFQPLLTLTSLHLVLAPPPSLHLQICPCNERPDPSHAPQSVFHRVLFIASFIYGIGSHIIEIV